MSSDTKPLDGTHIDHALRRMCGGGGTKPVQTPGFSLSPDVRERIKEQQVEYGEVKGWRGGITEGIDK